MEWERYEPGSKECYIPPGKWGKDHFSTLAYAETQAVDNGGVLDNRRMRTHARVHRHMVGKMPWGEMNDGGNYPTILRGGEKEEKHDDWSCLEDMAAHGLLVMEVRVVEPGIPFGGSEGRVTLTPLGQRVCAKLREHKARGGNFSEFAPDIGTLAVSVALATSKVGQPPTPAPATEAGA
jgi:hypothetical protein